MPIAASATAANSKPLGVSTGAVAFTCVHVPRLPDALQTKSGWSQAVLQHTPSTQKFDEH
jgi:hypothetical protein